MPRGRAPRGITHDPRQIPLITPECDWRPPSLGDLPQDWNHASRVAVDVETRDEHLRELGPGVRRGGYLVGVSFALEGGPSHYLPFAHEGGDNLDRDACLDYLAHALYSYGGDLVGANLGYDLDYLWAAGVLTPNVRRYRDIQVAEPLLNDLERRFGLDAQARRYLDEHKRTYLMAEAAACYGMQKPSDLGKWIWRLPGRYVGAYAEGDVELPLRIIALQEAELERQDLGRIYDLECRVLPALVRMRQRGIRFDQDASVLAERELERLIAEALGVVRRETGVALTRHDLTDVHAQVPVLHALGVEVPRTPKTGEPSVDKELLAAHSCPATNALAEARTLEKARRDYVVGYRRFVTHGRVHCTLNQMIGESEDGKLRGAAYGRMSCEDPNLQQVPARHPVIKRLVRGQLVPEEGALHAACDYSQQEPRWITHYAELCGLPKGAEAAQRYRDDPTTDNHQMMAELAGIPRSPAKIIYLGLCYGEGGVKLCRDLGLPTKVVERVRYGHRQLLEVPGDEGQALLDRFDEEVPYVRLLSDVCKMRAGRNGYIVTAGGRRCRFPQDDVGNYDWLHKALNRLIQGSSGDQTKEAVVLVDEAGYYLQLQVHDELLSSVATVREARDIGDIMTGAVPARVPFLVDVETGPSWGEVAPPGGAV